MVQAKPVQYSDGNGNITDGMDGKFLCGDGMKWYGDITVWNKMQKVEMEVKYWTQLSNTILHCIAKLTEIHNRPEQKNKSNRDEIKIKIYFYIYAYAIYTSMCRRSLVSTKKALDTTSPHQTPPYHIVRLMTMMM